MWVSPTTSIGGGIWQPRPRGTHLWELCRLPSEISLQPGPLLLGERGKQILCQSVEGAVPQNQVWGQRQGVIRRREGGEAGAGEGLGLFLRTCSQKVHILARVSQKHVAGRGSSTQSSRGCRCSRTCTQQPSPHRRVRHLPSIQRPRDQAEGCRVQAGCWGPRLADHGKWKRSSFQSPPGSSLALISSFRPSLSASLLCPTGAL